MLGSSLAGHITHCLKVRTKRNTPEPLNRSGGVFHQKGSTVDFEELLNQLRNPGEEGAPPTIYDDLSASYTDATSTRDAKIQTSEETVTQLQAELVAAKAANWDLLQSIPQVDNSDESVDDENNADESDSDDVGDDDDFFEKDHN